MRLELSPNQKSLEKVPLIHSLNIRKRELMDSFYDCSGLDKNSSHRPIENDTIKRCSRVGVGVAL